MKTLEELKAENAEEEAGTTEVTATEVEETETEAVEEETQEPEIPAEGETEESEETDTEAWMQADEQTSEGVEFTGSDIAAAKRKLKAKLERQHNDEMEQLRRENEALKSGSSQTQTQDQLPPRPKREDFDYDDDAYDAAIDAWNDKRFDAKLEVREQTIATTSQQQAAAKQLETSVDQHYERANKLVADAGIGSDVYKESDHSVRKAIEAARPGEGDIITDQLIAKVGEGSEKVMYYIGRNKDALIKLQSAIVNDPTGMQAMMYLGQVSSKVASPQKRVSRAPTPAAQIQGDAPVASAHKALKKKYQAAGKSGNVQAEFDARMEAKRAGADVSKW